MTGEFEVHHSPQLRFLLCTHYLFTHILIGNAVGIGTGLCIYGSSFVPLRVAAAAKAAFGSNSTAMARQNRKKEQT